MEIVTTFNLTLSWSDSRVIFYNLKDILPLNSIPVNGTLWSPRVGFVNTLDHATTVEDHKLSQFVKKTKLEAADVRSVPEERTNATDIFTLYT